MTEDRASLVALVRGRVQGVFFRDFVQGHASRLGLAGYVHNLPDGATVEVRAEGPTERLEELLRLLQKGSPRAKIERVDVEWGSFAGAYTHFTVRF